MSAGKAATMAHDMSAGAHAASGPATPATAYPTEPVVAGRSTSADLTHDLTHEAGDHSIGELLSQVTSDLSQLLRQEVELAKAEAKEEARKAGKAAGMFGGAGFAGYMVALFVTVTVMAALDVVMPLAVAALIVTAVWGIVALVLYTRARKEMRRVQGMPRTKDSLKEDAEWARHPTS
jgi:Flp pilus assembly protein TadB